MTFIKFNNKNNKFLFDLIRYAPFDMVHIICPILYAPYMVHSIRLKSYASNMNDHLFRIIMDLRFMCLSLNWETRLQAQLKSSKVILYHYVISELIGVHQVQKVLRDVINLLINSA